MAYRIALRHLECPPQLNDLQFPINRQLQFHSSIISEYTMFSFQSNVPIICHKSHIEKIMHQKLTESVLKPPRKICKKWIVLLINAGDKIRLFFKLSLHNSQIIVRRHFFSAPGLSHFDSLFSQSLPRYLMKVVPGSSDLFQHNFVSFQPTP